MLRGVLAFVLLLLASATVAAPLDAPHVRVELVADGASIAPGRDFDVGVRFELERGWHVYWRNPGDSGEAPRIEWVVPPGFSAGSLDWPAPERIPVGPLANFGYADRVLLPARLDVPDGLGAADRVDLAARLRWLVCDADECIPGRGTVGLTLPVGPPRPADPSVAALFAAARARRPLPPPADWEIRASATPDAFVLEVRGSGTSAAPAALFFPYAREVIEHAAPQHLTPTRDGFRLALARWRDAATTPPSLDGVLTVGSTAYAVAVPIGAAHVRFEPLAFAFLGGLLLNLMPCVFPVLALKALGLVGLAGEARRTARLHGLAYAAGVLLSFLLLASLLLALRAAGAPLGWGFQLQSPAVVVGLAGLFFWLALTLLGVCTIGGAWMGIGNRLAVRGGARGAFASGVLATVVATPCSAPFMGTALGYALVQPAPIALGVFTALAFGLALPYVVLTLVPALGARLPRPGAWMETLQQLLAFPLLATVGWLVWVASLQGGPDAVARALATLLLLAAAAWTLGRFAGRGARVAALALVAVALATTARIAALPASPTASRAGDAWEPYSAARVQELVAQGRPVFVDFTAAWCVTCQVNERVALDAPAVTAKMRELGVVPVRADWTRPDADIARALRRFGRDGVPLYLLYSGRDGDAPRILPQILTPDIVLGELVQLEERSRT